MADDIVTRLRAAARAGDLPLGGAFDCDVVADEIERLRRWKSEATAVIENWEAVWEAAGQPGVLGQSKSLGLLGELGRLDDEIERLRSAIDAVLLAVTDKGSHPEYHDEVRRRHEREWPTLWRAIAAMREARR